MHKSNVILFDIQIYWFCFHFLLANWLIENLVGIPCISTTVAKYIIEQRQATVYSLWWAERKSYPGSSKVRVGFTVYLLSDGMFTCPYAFSVR